MSDDPHELGGIVGKMIGIDLGTMNSCVAVMVDGLPQVIPNQEGARTTPSIVGFTAKGHLLVGQIAKRQALTNPKNTLYAVKRLIGRKYESPEIARVRHNLPYELTRAPNGDAHVLAGDKTYSPAQISAFVLQKLKSAAEDCLEKAVDGAVITVPAHFDDLQRNATKDGATSAGFKAITLLDDPYAAALAYGPRATNKRGQLVAVYDLGGGTFEITILDMADGLCRVRATAGDTYLGGEEFDQRIIDWLIGEFQCETGIDLTQDRLALQRLKEAAEKAKCELNTAQQTEIVLPFISADASGPKHFNTMLMRRRYNELTDELLEWTTAACTRCLSDAGLGPEEIDEVLVVGGQARAPRVIAAVRKAFGREPNVAAYLDGGLATGAAIQAGITQGTVKNPGTIRRTAPRARDAIRSEMERHAREEEPRVRNDAAAVPVSMPAPIWAFWRSVWACDVETGHAVWLQVRGVTNKCRFVNADSFRVWVLTRAAVFGGEEGILGTAKVRFRVVIEGVGAETRSPTFAELVGPRRWPVQVLLRLLGSDLDPDKVPRPSRDEKAADNELRPSGPEPIRLPPGQPTPPRIPHS